MHILLSETFAAAQVDKGAAVAFKQRLRRQPQGVPEGFGGDEDARAHAGAEFRNGVVQREPAFEVAFPEIAGGAAQILDVGLESAIGQGDDVDLGRLGDGEVAAVGFGDLRTHLPMTHIGDLRDGHARARLVADLVQRQRHAAVNHVLIHVLFHIHVAAGGGLDAHHVDIAVSHFDLNLGLFPGGLLDVDAGLGGGFAFGIIVFQLGQTFARALHGQLILAGSDGRQQGIAAGLQFGIRQRAAGSDQLVCELLFLGRGFRAPASKSGKPAPLRCRRVTAAPTIYKT